MAKKKSSLKVEKVGSSKKEKLPDVPVQDENISPEPDQEQDSAQDEPVVESKLEKLQKEAVELGMPEEDVIKFEDAKLLELSVNALRAVKASATPVIADPVIPGEERAIEKKWRNKAQRQKEYFDSLPKVRIIIPTEGKEKPGVVEERVVNGIRQMVAVSGAVWSKTFNGYRVVIPKGVYVTVSEAIADNISEEFNQIQESNNRFSVDRIDPKTGKPVSEQL